MPEPYWSWQTRTRRPYGMLLDGVRTSQSMDLVCDLLFVVVWKMWRQVTENLFVQVHQDIILATNQHLGRVRKASSELEPQAWYIREVEDELQARNDSFQSWTGQIIRFWVHVPTSILLWRMYRAICLYEQRWIWSEIATMPICRMPTWRF